MRRALLALLLAAWITGCLAQPNTRMEALVTNNMHREETYRLVAWFAHADANETRLNLTKTIAFGPTSGPGHVHALGPRPCEDDRTGTFGVRLTVYNGTTSEVMIEWQRGACAQRHVHFALWDHAIYAYKTYG